MTSRTVISFSGIQKAESDEATTTAISQPLHATEQKNAFNEPVVAFSQEEPLDSSPDSMNKTAQYVEQHARKQDDNVLEADSSHMLTPSPRLELYASPSTFQEKPYTLGDNFWNSVGNVEKKKIGFGEYMWVSILLLGFLFAFAGVVWNNRSGTQLVLSAGSASAEAFDQRAYADWSQKYFGKLVTQDGDEDSDELKNKEEFLVGSDPTKFSSCNNSISDAETLYELIDPKTCQAISINNEEVINRVSKVMDLKRLNQQLASAGSSSSSSSSSLSSIISALIDNQLLSRDQIDSAQKKLEQQKQYAELLEKVDAYIALYRSYGTFDRDYETPIDSVVYLQVSLKYNVPMKYMMAIARLESRFGTDRFTDSGAQTRPGQYKNIYSLGLDDSGNNLNFVAWEDGVEAFGRWYKNMEEKGVSDCAKWRIYNPNGDYCSKVETTARNFEDFRPPSRL